MASFFLPTPSWRTLPGGWKALHAFLMAPFVFTACLPQPPWLCDLELVTLPLWTFIFACKMKGPLLFSLHVRHIWGTWLGIIVLGLAHSQIKKKNHFHNSSSSGLCKCFLHYSFQPATSPKHL
jgi:hypothetical protein